MSRRMHALFLVVLTTAIVSSWTSLPAPAWAQAAAEQRTGAAPANTDRAMTFVREVAQALGRRDRAAVANLVRYPATAAVAGLGIPISSADDLIARFDSIFTAELRCSVDSSVSAGAKSIDVVGGVVTFAAGRIRAEDASGTYRITHINVPPPLGLSGPSKTERVGLRRGQTQFSGRLYANGVDTYILSAQKGDVLQVRIEGFSGRSASVRVVEAKSGRSLNAPGATAPRQWTGTIQQPGEYRVEVVRHSACGASFTYLLTIALK